MNKNMDSLQQKKLQRNGDHDPKTTSNNLTGWELALEPGPDKNSD